ncbi:MAG TPA: carbohydrate binding domain-containing protein, partial [Polyangiaceae bacterium]|nr:carbohydrate binding domain-containing protein [Polyangiaceae bacterium]
MNRLSLLGISAFLIALPFTACDRGNPVRVPCANAVACAQGQECSGGYCVAIQACSTAEPCPAAQKCVNNVCRNSCVDDAPCTPLGLRCDTAVGSCLPTSVPLGTGGMAGATSGGSGAGGSASTMPGGGTAGTTSVPGGTGGSVVTDGGMTAVGGAPTGGAGGAGGASGEQGPSYSLIDDLEDGNGRILEIDGRTGPWYVVSDGSGSPSATGTLTPEADAENKAVHFKLGGDASSWGSGVQVDLKNPGDDAKADSRSGWDASAYTGLTFRAKGNGSLRLKLNTSSVVSQEEKGTCASDCFNAHGANLTLGSSWKTYVVVFGSETSGLPEGEKLTLAQEDGWGTKVEFKASELMGLTLQGSKAFELWMDDVKLFKKGSTNPSNGTGGGGGMGTGGSSGGGGECKDEFWSGYAAGQGSVTRYDFSQGTSLPACAYVITHKGAGRDGDWDTVEGISTGDGGYFGAMNTSDYKNGAACGACVEVSYNGKKVVATIVDECPIGTNPVCTAGHIDLSRKAIRQLESNASLEHLGKGGNGSVSWRYVACPVTGNVEMR